MGLWEYMLGLKSALRQPSLEEEEEISKSPYPYLYHVGRQLAAAPTNTVLPRSAIPEAIPSVDFNRFGKTGEVALKPKASPVPPPIPKEWQLPQPEAPNWEEEIAGLPTPTPPAVPQLPPTSSLEASYFDPRLGKRVTISQTGKDRTYTDASGATIDPSTMGTIGGGYGRGFGGSDYADVPSRMAKYVMEGKQPRVSDLSWNESSASPEGMTGRWIEPPQKGQLPQKAFGGGYGTADINSLPIGQRPQSWIGDQFTGAKIAMEDAEIRAKIAQAKQGEAEAGLRGVQTEQAAAGIPLTQAQATEGIRQIGIGPIGRAKEEAQAAISGYSEAMALMEKSVEPQVEAFLQQLPPEQRTPQLLPAMRAALQEKVMRNELSGPRYFAIMSLLEKKVQQPGLTALTAAS